MLLQRGMHFGRWFHTLLSLESNEYQPYMLEFASYFIQKLCDLFLGGGGGVIKRSHSIRGGRSRRAKKSSHNFWTLLNVRVKNLTKYCFRMFGSLFNFGPKMKTNILDLIPPGIAALQAVSVSWGQQVFHFYFLQDRQISIYLRGCHTFIYTCYARNIYRGRRLYQYLKRL